MTSTALTIHELTHDPLTPLDPNQAPTPMAIHNLISELYANARQIETELGGGHLGHLGLVMTAADYLALAGPGNAYIVPDVRPDIPDYSNALDAGERDEMRDLYNAELREYNEVHGLAAQLKNQLIKAVPIIYINVLKHRLHRFANVTIATLLAHLTTHYGTIDSDDLGANFKKLTAPWDPTTSIENVFTTGTDCRDFATLGGEPIGDVMYMRYLLEIFAGSGVLDKAVTDWKDKPTVDKTVPNFEAHFYKANKNRCNDTKGLKDALSANTASTLTTSTATGHEFKGFSYCWSHGVCDHSGTDCPKPATGHIKTATIHDLSGGCTFIQRPPGFKPVWQFARDRPTTETAKEKEKRNKDKEKKRVAAEARETARTAALATAITVAMTAAANTN
jgi:hypothetical protein